MAKRPHLTVDDDSDLYDDDSHWDPVMEGSNDEFSDLEDDIEHTPPTAPCLSGSADTSLQAVTSPLKCNFNDFSSPVGPTVDISNGCSFPKDIVKAAMLGCREVDKSDSRGVEGIPWLQCTI